MTSPDSPSLSTERNWPGDYLSENGNYENRCIECGEMFIGYKRRVVCRLCASRAPALSEGGTPEKLHFENDEMRCPSCDKQTPHKQFGDLLRCSECGGVSATLASTPENNWNGALSEGEPTPALSDLLGRLMWMVEVQPGKKVPYLQGCYGNSEIKEIVPAIEALFRAGEARISGVTWLLIRDGCVLMEKCPKKAAKLGVGEWFVPGGKIEGDESAEQALLREIGEEWPGVTVLGSTPLPIVQGSPIGVDVEGAFLMQPFLVTVHGEIPTRSADGVDLKWTPLSEALASPVAQVRMMIAATTPVSPSLSTSSPELTKLLDEFSATVSLFAEVSDEWSREKAETYQMENAQKAINAARSAIELFFATLTEQIKRLNRRLDEWQESEASVCPEDWGFVEYVKQLETSFNRTAKELLASQADRAALVLTPEEASAVLDALEHGKIGMDRMQWWFDAKAKLEASRRRSLSGETPK